MLRQRRHMAAVWLTVGRNIRSRRRTASYILCPPGIREMFFEDVYLRILYLSPLQHRGDSSAASEKKRGKLCVSITTLSCPFGTLERGGDPGFKGWCKHDSFHHFLYLRAHYFLQFSTSYRMFKFIFK